MKKLLFYFCFGTFLIESFFPITIVPVMGLSLKNIALYGAILILFVTEIAGGGIRKKKIPGIFFLLAILVGIPLNILFLKFSGESVYPLSLHFILFKLRIFDAIMFFLVFFLLIDSEENGRQALLSAIIGFSLINIISFLTAQMGFDVFNERFVSELADAEGRFRGAYKNSNQMAYFLCFLMPLMYYFFKKNQRTFFKIIMILLIIAGIVGVLFSGSRGGILSLCIVITATIILYGDFKTGIVLLVFSFIFLGAAWMTGNEAIHQTVDRLSILIEGDVETASNKRFDIWRGYGQVLHSEQHSFFTGAGFAMGRVSLKKITGFDVPVHNFYLQTLVDFGLFGLVFLLCMIFWFFRVVLKTKHGLFKKIMVVAMTIILFGWLFTNLLNIQNYIAIIFSLSLAYLMQLNNDHAR